VRKERKDALTKFSSSRSIGLGALVMWSDM